jgi:hypothetical protein
MKFHENLSKDSKYMYTIYFGFSNNVYLKCINVNETYTWLYSYNKVVLEIWGSHNSADGKVVFLRCDVVWTWR